MSSLMFKYKGAILNAIGITVFFVIIYISFQYLLPFFAPFVIGLIIAILNEPMIKLLEKRFKIHRKLASFISIFLSTSILIVLLIATSISVYNELERLQGNFSRYYGTAFKDVNELLNKFTKYYNSLPDTVTTTVNNNLASLSKRMVSIIDYFGNFIINTITSIPRITVFIIVSFLSAYFVSSDSEHIKKFLLLQLPRRIEKHFDGIRKDTFTAMFGYFKAILILMAITFIEISIGLMIIGVDYAIVMGLVVALAEIIPILGTGIIMVPWILWNLMVGNIQVAIGLSIIYILGVIIRQALEPKIVGDQIGLHPLVTLISMYIGLEVFGVVGMIIGPLSMIILKSLQKSGIIKFWKDSRTW